MAVEIPLGLYAGIAQLVEYLICNQGVEGSSPPISSFHRQFESVPVVDVLTASLKPDF